METPNYDFKGYATRNGIRCSDGRTIMRDAFKECDGKTVPLVWNHRHGDATDVLGHALLENRDDGVYAYGFFNNTAEGKRAKELVTNGDITALSIYANQLKQQNGNVTHGVLREVSLVLAGANPGAFIDSVIAHGEESEEAFIYSGEELELFHACGGKEDEEKKEKELEHQADPEQVIETKKEEEPQMAEKPKTAEEKTIKEIFDTLTEEQKQAVYAIVGAAVEDAKSGSSSMKQSAYEDDEGEHEMRHNLFEGGTSAENTLTHAEEMEILEDAKNGKSLKQTVLAHGITDISNLFPDNKNLTDAPLWIKRPDEWVGKVLGKVGRTPFARVKSLFADITEADARARGYITGNEKADEVFSVLKRTTDPTTVYKKQKINRDQLIDITDFNVVTWMKSEMRSMLDEELARAILIGDGRNVASDDHINTQNIRPIWMDDSLFVVRVENQFTNSSTADQMAKAFIRKVVKARKDYRGSGNLVLYTTEDLLTDLLLMEDSMGRVIYETVDKLKSALRVSDIVTVPVMENQTREGSGTDAGKTFYLDGILVNLADYNVGADKGGTVSMFDDFDIDFNAQKYLIETRCSGALTVPKSAIVVEHSFQ